MGINVYLWVLLAVIVILVIMILAMQLVKKNREYEELRNLIEDKFAKENLKKELKREEEESYRKFVPVELMKMMGIEKTEGVTKVLQKTVNAAVLNVNRYDFAKEIHSMERDQVFRLLNGMFGCAIPELQNADMAVERFDDGGITAVSINNMEKVLYACVAICEKLRCGEHGDDYRTISIGIDYGQVMAGIAGSKDRLCAMTVSEVSETASYLQSVGGRFYASILLTSSFAEKVENFEERYSSRILGYILLSSGKKVEKIYDVFDGDEASVKAAKRKTKRMFEKGAEAFVQGNIEEARKCFIEVLKMDRYDSAAKEYVFLCDTYMESGETGKAPLFLMVD